MDCKVAFSLVRETLIGDIGDDWEYSVQAEVFNPGPTGAGTIAVPEHHLTPGASQAPPVAARVMIPAGACASGPRVKLTLSATEVDWVVDDHGSNVLAVPLECPGPGGPPFILEPEISAQIREAPGIFSGSARLKIKVRLEATCV